MATTKVYCDECEGNRTIEAVFPTGLPGYVRIDEIDCPACNGKGFIERDMAELTPEKDCHFAEFSVGLDGGNPPHVAFRCLMPDHDPLGPHSYLPPIAAKAFASQIFRAADEAEGKR